MFEAGVEKFEETWPEYEISEIVSCPIGKKGQSFLKEKHFKVDCGEYTFREGGYVVN